MQSTSGESAQCAMLEDEHPPEYHTIQPRAVIECIRTSSAPLPPSGSSQAFKVNGMIYVAAQVAALPRGGMAIGETAAVERIFLNLEAILKAAGSSFDRVVKTTVYFSEYVHGKKKFEDHYNRVFPFAPPRTTVVVPGFSHNTPAPYSEIQVELIAVE